MINKVYLLELKKYQVDPAQMVSTIGKGADRLRTAGRGASELYNEIRYIFEEGGDQQTMSTILEKAGRLAVYCLATGKELDKDAKDLSTKALRLPDSLKYLEDDDEDENKVLFFSSEVIEKIQKTRFEDSVIKISSSSSRPQGGFNVFLGREEAVVPHIQQRSTPKLRNVHKKSHYTIPEDGIPPGSRLQKFLYNWKRLTKHQ
ncbi:hypothetical protein BCV71DRAFT_271914, partial [Rhizopus microsporus]